MELAGRGAWAVKPPADFLLPFAFRFTTERSFRMRIFSLLAGSRSGFFGAATAGAEASGACGGPGFRPMRGPHTRHFYAALQVAGAAISGTARAEGNMHTRVRRVSRRVWPSGRQRT